MSEKFSSGTINSKQKKNKSKKLCSNHKKTYQSKNKTKMCIEMWKTSQVTCSKFCRYQARQAKVKIESPRHLPKWRTRFGSRKHLDKCWIYGNIMRDLWGVAAVEKLSMRFKLKLTRQFSCFDEIKACRCSLRLFGTNLAGMM